MNETKFSIDLRILKGMAHLASKDEMRYVLTGVCVELRTNETRVVATNGRCLACYRIPNESHESERKMVIPLFWLNFLRNGKTTSAQFSCNDKSFEVSLGERTFKGKLIEGDFPNYKQALPNGDTVPVKSFNFDIELAKLFVDCLKTINPRKSAAVVIRQHKDELGAISILAENDPNFYGVQMPYRSSTDKIPDWVTQ